MDENKWATTWQNQQNECVPSEDPDQPGHLPNLIRVFAVCMKKAWVLSYPLSAQRRLWPDWADAGRTGQFAGFVVRQLKSDYSTGKHAIKISEPPHDKTNKMTVHRAKTQISLGISSVWSESSLSAWRQLGSLATHWAHSEDSDQTGRMPSLIGVFAWRIVILLVLSWGGSFLNTTF